VVALLCGLNVIGVKEATCVNIVLAVTDFATQLLLVMVGAVLVLSDARAQRAPRHRAVVEELRDRDPGGDDRLHGDRDDLEHNVGALQPAAVIYVGLLAATILFIATNAGIIGVSRLVYSMGLHRQLPDGLRQLHPRSAGLRPSTGRSRRCSANVRAA